MPEYLITYSKSFTIEAEDEDEAGDKANDFLMETDAEGCIETIEEL